ncbi:hypothetical protein EV421DRAFT_1910334 [Armillaria borealis]|uniref:Uncharacterized protein n=1 Tax=Armillaria borealis TaxID=47425 RepID=A0AA39J2D6_9AGAR|nr:hypothetical protein EV421DRAFT_1910334 [Armillaria borealis]
MTGNHPTAAPINDEAHNILQITHAQHDQIGHILSCIQPVAVPAPASARARGSAAPANAAESSGARIRMLAAPPPSPAAPVPHAMPVPPAAPVPPAMPVLPPNLPYGPLPANAVMVPQGYDYHVPHPTRRGPFYMIVCGLDIGIFAGWEDAAALVIGVSGSVYCKVPNVHVGCARLDAALAGHGAAWLP